MIIINDGYFLGTKKFFSSHLAERSHFLFGAFHVTDQIIETTRDLNFFELMQFYLFSFYPEIAFFILSQ